MRSAGLALAVVLLAAACAGGDERLSRREFVARADAICERYNEKLVRLGKPENLKDAAAIAERAVPIVRDGVRELRNLEPPEELEALADRWYRLNERNVDYAERLRDAARSGDLAAVRTIVRETRTNEEKADRLARRLGLAACAEEA